MPKKNKEESVLLSGVLDNQLAPRYRWYSTDYCAIGTPFGFIFPKEKERKAINKYKIHLLVDPRLISPTSICNITVVLNIAEKIIFKKVFAASI